MLRRRSAVILRSRGTRRWRCDRGSNEDDAAAVAEVSAASYYSDTWPDGTPKKFRGREAWKNYIDYESSFKTQTDELNRQRHYFFHVDNRGRLWRKELHKLDGHEGQLKDARILNFFFSHMQPNRTGHHTDLFPFVSLRAHEHYFTSCADAPIVFNDLREGELRHLCPNGELAHSISTRFDPAEVRITSDGKLLHPVLTKVTDVIGAKPRAERLMALIESSTALQILECCDEQHSPNGNDDGILLRWDGSETVLQRWESDSS